MKHRTARAARSPAIVGGPPAILRQPPDEVANEFQRVCLQLRLVHPDAHSLIVTAPCGREGTSTVAVLCATALTEIVGGTVVLVDANLRAPTLHRRFGLTGAAGLRGWDPTRPAEGIHATPRDRLSVLPAGRGSDDAGAGGSLHALHRSGRLAALAQRLREEFSFVVWDTPAINTFPDARFLLPHADGVLVVAEADMTPLGELATLCEQTAPVGCPVLGVILNRTGRFWAGARPRQAPARPSWNASTDDLSGA
jgi:Mrp family chromosome partitioning ATPase